jgi:hypothetical protein
LEQLNQKIVYRVLSLHTGTPVYRVYNHEQAQDILLECRNRYPEQPFWLEKQERDLSWILKE